VEGCHRTILVGLGILVGSETIEAGTADESMPSSASTRSYLCLTLINQEILISYLSLVAHLFIITFIIVISSRLVLIILAILVPVIIVAYKYLTALARVRRSFD